MQRNGRVSRSGSWRIHERDSFDALDPQVDIGKSWSLTSSMHQIPLQFIEATAADACCWRECFTEVGKSLQHLSLITVEPLEVASMRHFT